MLNQDEAKKIWELVKPLKTAMLVSSYKGSLQARPMQLMQSEFKGKFYFLTRHPSDKTQEIQSNDEVCLTFSCPKDQTYVSVSGVANISYNPELIDSLWSSAAEAWFNTDKRDINVAVIEISPFQAEYWDTPEMKVTQLFKYAKALLTNQSPDIGEHQKV